MRIAPLVAVLTIAVTGAGHAANSCGHAHEGTPLHGGIVAMANELDFELVPNTVSRPAPKVALRS